MCWLRVLYLIKFCAYFCGFVFLTNVVSQGCSSSVAQEHLFLNVGDNVTFYVGTDEVRGHFEFYHETNHICTFEILYHHLDYKKCISTYENRTLVGAVISDRYHTTVFNITILKAERSDNGSYQVHYGLLPYSKCFSIYILGMPASEIRVTSAAIHVGDEGIMTCSANSTTMPETHNLAMHIVWYIDGQIIRTGGRFRVYNDVLSVHVVTKADINLMITCEAKEERGRATTTNTTLPIDWGPEPGPELQPPNTFYHIEPGIQLSNILCIVDCYPACELRWYKLGSPAVLSYNGTLSLGIFNRNSTGEYMCTTTNSRTTKESSVSIYILIKEDQERSDMG